MNIIKKIKWYFTGKKLQNEYEDQFRIRVITLKNNLTKYYPEYYTGITTGWEQLVLINNKAIGNVFLSESELVSNISSYCDTEEQAILYIEKYKEQLVEERKNEFLKEEIIDYG